MTSAAVSEIRNTKTQTTDSVTICSQKSKMSAQTSPIDGKTVNSNTSVKRLPFSVDSLLAKTTKRRSHEDEVTSANSDRMRAYKTARLLETSKQCDEENSGLNQSYAAVDKRLSNGPHEQSHDSSLSSQFRATSSPLDNTHLPASPASPLRHHQRVDTTSSHSDLQSPRSSVQSYSDDDNDESGEIDIDNDDDDDTCDVKQKTQQLQHGKENSFQTYQLNVSGLIDKERFGRVDGAMGHHPALVGWPPHLPGMPWMSMAPFSKPGKL